MANSRLWLRTNGAWSYVDLDSHDKLHASSHGVSGADPIMGILPAPTYKTTYYYGVPIGARSTALLGNGNCDAHPVVIHRTITIDRIGIETTASATAGGTLRLGIWNDSNGIPGTVLLDAGTVDATVAAAWLEITGLSQQLLAGVYWLGYAAQGAAATPATIRVATTPQPGLGFRSSSNAKGAAPSTAVEQTGVTGAFGTFSVTGMSAGAGIMGIRVLSVP